MHTDSKGLTTEEKQAAARLRNEALRTIERRKRRVLRALERSEKRTAADALREIRREKI